MDTALNIMIGVGLSAACGLRVFLPVLLMGLAAHYGFLNLGETFEWMGSPAALIAAGTATVLEIASYYVPWLDNVLDSLSSPAAVAAGALTTGAMVSDMDPWLSWTAATILGGGAAGVVQAGTVIARGTSTVTTGGLANPALSTAETGGALAIATTAIFWPVVALIVVIALVAVSLFLLVKFVRRGRRRNPKLR